MLTTDEEKKLIYILTAMLAQNPLNTAELIKLHNRFKCGKRKTKLSFYKDLPLPLFIWGISELDVFLSLLE